MADRYLRASGNWNSTSVWSATSGGAVGASVPGVSDNVYMNGPTAYTLNLNVDAKVLKFTMNAGTLNLNSYTLEATNFGAYNAASTINGNSGSLIVNSRFDSSLMIDGANFNAGTSLVVINVVSSSYDIIFATAGKTFNDVRINMGQGISTSTNLDITGSPTFRLLDIRSANSVAHTVDFDSQVTMSKFIAIGASTADRLLLTGSGDFVLSDDGSSYGQFVNAGIDISSVFGTKYIGSNSIMSGTAVDWVLQDPPKISTLIDPLTIAPESNPNWIIQGSVGQVSVGQGGGGYQDDFGIVTSVDTYDDALPI